MKHIILIIISLFSLHLNAVPAYTGKITILLENGKSVSITMKGDEHFKYALSEDGYTLLCDNDKWYYATTDESGNLVTSKFSLTVLDDATEDLKEFKKTCPKHLKPIVCDNMHNAARRTKRIGIHTGEPMVGDRRALVVLMQYKDVHFSKSIEDFERLFNEEGYSSGSATGSVRDFYQYASSGQLDYRSDIYGPFTATHEMRYYGQNSQSGGKDMNAVELCIEAIRNLPKDIDYSLYDNDKDGLVDNIHIIFAGYGEESSAPAYTIWSHEYPYKIVMKHEVGVNFAGYSCTPELRGNMGKKISSIGVICHELGHALGANDYYDTNSALGGSYEGTAHWDIMGSGSWNKEGDMPANFNPYVRTHDFGWEKVVELKEEGEFVLSKHSITPENNIVLKIGTESSGDYFLLENRQQEIFDAALPGKGLMIYHVHPSIEHLSASNSINCSNPQGLYPVCASGSIPSSKYYGNIDSGECPFPGTRNVTSFSINTSPASKAWDGSPSLVDISHIKQLQDGSISFYVNTNGYINNDSIVDEPDELETIFSDSFESGLSGYDSKILMGKQEWTVFPSNKIISNTDLIPAASDGKKLLMLFTGKNQNMCEAIITRKEIAITPDQRYLFSFDVSTSFLSKDQTPMFKFWIRDENGEIYDITLTKWNDQWENIEMPFSSPCNSIEYGFYGLVNSGGIFVDNIKIESIANPIRIESINSKKQKEDVYTLQGIKIDCPLEQLEHGLYIIGGKKVIR